MKKRWHLILIFFLTTGASSLLAQPVAFPGAEGFGRFAKGARAQSEREVYRVTQLGDSGEGSLRDAVSKPGRVVIFTVSGVIRLKSRLSFSANSYIAGQTAPGQGILVYGNGVSFSGADNIIVQHLRFRMGKNGEHGKDAAGVAGGKQMIFDHLSVSWGLDENFSISGAKGQPVPENITIQNSIIGQGLMVHSCGGLIQTPGGVSLLGNLYIDNKTRNPKVKGLNQFVGNIVYNWGEGGAYILGDSESPSWAEIRDNLFIKGPSSRKTPPFSRANRLFSLIHAGNLYDSIPDGNLQPAMVESGDFGNATIVSTESQFTGKPADFPPISTRFGKPDFQRFESNTGALPNHRDATDSLLIVQLKSAGTLGKLIFDEAELGFEQGVGLLSSQKASKDSDNDGMPDDWEKKNGLNPKNAKDALLIGADGYLNIERYIHSIVF